MHLTFQILEEEVYEAEIKTYHLIRYRDTLYNCLTILQEAYICRYFILINIHVSVAVYNLQFTTSVQ